MSVKELSQRPTPNETLVVVFPDDPTDNYFHDPSELLAKRAALGTPTTVDSAIENWYEPCTDCFETPFSSTTSQ